MYFKSNINYERRRLVELMQSINFGRIDGLQIRERNPVFEPWPTIRREYKFGSENCKAPNAEDFQLKHQVCELFKLFDVIVAGTIDQLEIKHGLPFRLMITEYRGMRGKEWS